MGKLTKQLIGKEDLSIQYNINDPEQFIRLNSVGGTINLYQIPDIWTGTGKINIAKCATPATDPGDITETITLGTLTHDVLKDKINEILAALRIADFFT